MNRLSTKNERNAIHVALIATILIAGAAVRAEPPAPEITPEVDYLKQADWQETMLDVRRRIGDAGRQVDLMAGSGYAHKFW